MPTIETIAVIDMLVSGYRPPSPNHIHYDRLLAEWQQRWQYALVRAQEMVNATEAAS